MHNRKSVKIAVSLRVLVSILILIAITSVYLVPKHIDKHAEADVAKLLLNIYNISLAYHNAIPDSSVLSTATERQRFESERFGEPPPAFEALATAYRLSDDITISSIVVNHRQPFTALLIRAESDWGKNVLGAYDVMTEYEHAYVTPNVIMMVFDNGRQIQPEMTVTD